MRFATDGLGQPYVEWQIGPGGWKRAWIQDRRALGPEKDWANTGFYLNVVRIEKAGSGPAGNATDFPIYSSVPHRQILESFVLMVSAVTGAEVDIP